MTITLQLYEHVKNVMNETPFVPRKMLVSGAAGYILSHTVDYFLETYPDLEIVVIDKLDYCSSRKNLDDAVATGRCRLVVGDCANQDLVSYLMETEHFDSMIHGAASSCVDESFGYDSFRMYIHNNVIATATMLEAAKRYNDSHPESPVKRILCVATDEVAGDSNTERLTENAPLLPTTPYSCTKAAAAIITRAYVKTYGLPIVEARPANVSGLGRQHPTKLIPKWSLRMLNGMKLCIHGEGKTKRCFLHVMDCARAFDCLLTRGVVGEAYNIESKNEFSVLEVAHKFLKAFNIPEDQWDNHLEFVADRLVNDSNYLIDGSKLEKTLGFKQIHTDFDKNLAETIEWYREHRRYWPNVDEAIEPHPHLT